MSRQQHSGDFIFPVLSWKDKVKSKEGLYEETQNVSVRLRAVGDLKASGCFDFFRMFPDQGQRANSMLNHPYLYFMVAEQCTNSNIPNRTLISGSWNGINALITLRVSKL